MGTDDLGSGVDVPVVPPANHRPVKIEVVLNGYLVKVGCQNVVFESLDKMLKELGKYYRNPAAVEREYLKKGEAK